MPLPDETSHQSVANLIGRFERQNKRNSLSASAPVAAPQPLAVPSRSPPIVDRKPALAPRNDIGLLNARSSSTALGGNTSSSSQKLPDASEKSEKEIPSAPISHEHIEIEDTPTLLASLPRKSKSPSPLPSTTSENPAPKPTSPTPPKATISKSSSIKKSPIAVKSSATPAVPTASSRGGRPGTATSTRTPIKPQATGGSTPAHRPLRPQHTGASVASNASQPHYATPIRTQPTGTGPAARTPPSAPGARTASTSTSSTPLRAKTPVVARSRISIGSSALTAPTASSLAKARQPVAKPPSASTPITNVTKKLPSTAATPPESKKTPASTRSTSATPSVPFPSVRKPKTSVSKGTAPVGAARRPRMSLPGGGPSAAALAARAAVAAPPVPPVPASSDADAHLPAKARASSATASNERPTIGRASEPMPATKSSPTVAFPKGPESGPEVIALSASDASVLVVDTEGSVVAPPAGPLTEEALDAHDHIPGNEESVVRSRAGADLEDAVAMLEFGSGGVARLLGNGEALSNVAVLDSEAGFAKNRDDDAQTGSGEMNAEELPGRGDEYQVHDENLSAGAHTSGHDKNSGSNSGQHQQGGTHTPIAIQEGREILRAHQETFPGNSASFPSSLSKLEDVAVSQDAAHPEKGSAAVGGSDHKGSGNGEAGVTDDDVVADIPDEA